MPRTRQLKHDFFLNEELAAVEPIGRLLFAGLWVLADREGRLEDRPARIKAQLFPYEEMDIDGLLLRLACGFIQRYQANGGRYIQIPNFKKHQHIHPDEKASQFPGPPDLNQEIPGDFKTSQEIMPYSPSPSFSPSNSPSPKQPGQGPIDLKNLGGLAKGPESMAGDYSDYRLPKDFGGRYGRAYIVNLTPDDCRFILTTMRPGPKVRAALEWRIALKAAEAIK